MSGSYCCFLTCILISQEAGKVVWYSQLLKNFPQFVVIHKVKGFGLVIEAEVDAFSMIQRMLAIWYQVPLSFLNPAWASENSRFMYCWSFTWRILSITLLACEMSATVWLFEHSLALPFKEIKPVNPKGNQSWIFIGRTDAEAEAPLLWPTDVKNWLNGKDPDAGKDWRQEEKGMTEDEMVGWHHQLNGHEFEQALGAGEGQGSLACYQSMGSQGQTQLRDWTTTGGSLAFWVWGSVF